MGILDYDPTKPVKSNKENQLKSPTEITTKVGGLAVASSGIQAMGNPVSNELATTTPVGLESALPPLTEDSKIGAKLGTAGLSTLAEAPRIINNFQNKAQSKEEATGKVLSMASSGAKIGSAFGPWGMAAGAVVGAGAGIISNVGWKEEFNDNADDDLMAEADSQIAERKQNYYDSKTSEQIQANKNIYLQANGYSSQNS